VRLIFFFSVNSKIDGWSSINHHKETRSSPPSLASHSITCGSRAGTVALLNGQGHSGEAEIDLEKRE